MKQLLVFSTLLLLLSCKKEVKPSYVIFDGNIKNSVAEEAIISGKDFEAILPIGSDGKFGDTLDIKENGYYELYINRERTAIYLEKGKTLVVNLDAMRFDETLAYGGELAAENNYLATKFLMDENNKGFEKMYTLSEEEFSEELKRQNTKYDSLLKSSKISNKTFTELETRENKYGYTTNLEVYEEYHRYLTGEKEFSVSQKFYDPISDMNFTDTTAFRKSVAYQNMLNTHYSRLAGEEGVTGFLKKVDESLPDGYAKDKLMSDFLEFGLKPDENLEEAYEIYKASSTNEENLSRITDRYNVLKTITKGNPSPAFNYENYKGGTTSLADLKGKYVYVDVWATWCGPCIREIPALKKIEEEFSRKNVAFVSISIDRKSEYETWKSMIAEKDLGGIQLFADNDWKSQFIVDYGILGIPRFIIIDPQGNIVSADAPRPSDPDLKKMLEELI